MANAGKRPPVLSRHELAKKLVEFYKQWNYYEYMNSLEVGEGDEDAVEEMEALLAYKASTSALEKTLSETRDKQAEPEDRDAWNELIEDLERYRETTFSTGGKKNVYYVLVSEWAVDYETGHELVGLYNSEDDAKTALRKRVAIDEKPLADEYGYEIYTDTDTCFDAGRSGYYIADHLYVGIETVEMKDTLVDDGERLSFSIEDDNALKIWLGNKLLSEISSVPQYSTLKEVEKLIDEVLFGLGYIWNYEDGTLTTLERSV